VKDDLVGVPQALMSAILAVRIAAPTLCLAISVSRNGAHQCRDLGRGPVAGCTLSSGDVLDGGYDRRFGPTRAIRR
jgi:hypothetical protein